MSERELRRSMSVFPIGTVMKLTDLSARQIRYYEEQQLIDPERSEGNRRLYSLNDIDILLEIKDYLSTGLNMAGVKRALTNHLLMKRHAQEKAGKTLTDADIRRVLQNDFLNQGGFLKNESPMLRQPRL
ncbi:MAG: MerR family transcriptional regulator [Lactobacillales bacterium]|jgi:MerR family glutamine synthetase transcriptional repressor|nr:MerR family transcriptional regulator [Lactobacillales bacterium]